MSFLTLSQRSIPSFAMSVALALSATAQAVPKNQPIYRGVAIEAIDLHMHPGRYKDLGPIGKDFLRQTLPNFLPNFLKDLSLSAASSFLLNPYGPFIGIKSECDQAGMSYCGLFAVYSPATWGVTSNETVLGYLDDRRNRRSDTKDPLFFGLASIAMQDWDKREKEELKALASALDHPLMKGIKLAFIHNSIPLDDTRFDSIYQLAAERQVPIYHHIGSSPLRKLSDFTSLEEQETYLRSYDPAGLERAIKAYPSVPFILGHMGFDFNQEGHNSLDKVLDLASTYPNVYLEISAFGGSMHDPKGDEMFAILHLIKEKGLIEKTLYGSDGPTIPGGTKQYLEATLRAMDKLNYTPAEAAAILSGTTQRLFQLAAPRLRR